MTQRPANLSHMAPRVAFEIDRAAYGNTKARMDHTQHWLTSSIDSAPRRYDSVGQFNLGQSTLTLS